MPERNPEALHSEGFMLEEKTANGSYVEIAEMVDFDWNDGETTVRDVTTLADNHRRKRPGKRDAGTLSLTLNFVPGNSGHRRIRENKAAGKMVDWRITFPDDAGTQLLFHGFVTSAPVTVPEDDNITATVSFAVDGEPGLAPAEGA